MRTLGQIGCGNMRPCVPLQYLGERVRDFARNNESGIEVADAGRPRIAYMIDFLWVAGNPDTSTRVISSAG